MEKSWKILGLCLGLLYCELCNGLPINLENTVADSHTQLLTGLVAVLLTVCSVVFLAGCLCCQRRNGFKEFRDSPVVASTASNLDHGHINPVANGEFTIFTPLSPPHQNNNVFLANQQIITRTQEDYVCGDVDVSSWFSGSETDFPRIKLKYIKEIGKGWFGRVVEGAAQDVNSDQKWTPVVVRILEATASSRERVVFLHDAAIYRCGVHQNILKLLGRCLDTIPLLLLQEYCSQGDLKNYLRQNKPTADKLLSSEYPLIWCCQLSSALKHLHENKLTHPDLAARNCQLTSNLTLKLGDYGLAVFQYPEDYYQGAPGVPVRWCAPETLSYTSTTIQPKKITLEANIWSFAVTMWEICECGEQPYPNLSDDEVISQVLGAQNVRLSRPKYQVLYTDYIFRLMQLCWTGSESRPAMMQIDLMLGDLLQVYKNTTSTHQVEKNVVSMKDFDKRWESFKPNSIVKTDNHITDSTEIDLDDSEIVTSKPLSPSLNNLHGSLDNLLVESSESQMESWLENVASKTGDMSYVRGLSDAIKDLDNAIALENNTSSDSSHQQSPAPERIKTDSKIEFKLGPLGGSKPPAPDFPNQHDSLTDSSLFIPRTSSESETEEENWKRKIERGAYSEKVRQKSRSVADLMVLTHIDPSESESETPLPSLDYRTNYKNVRYAPKQNLENASLMFGSEGNLLNVQETFQEELKKLQEERRDSLLFVPENRSQDNSSENLLSDSAGDDDTVNAKLAHNASSVSTYLEDSPSKRLLQELNSTSEIKPANQVFNVFNVTIDKFSPVHLKPKLNEFIHYTDDDDCVDTQACDVHGIPKLADIVQSNSELINYFNKEENGGTCLSDGEGDNSEVMYDSGVEGDRMESTESLKNPSEEKLDELHDDMIKVGPENDMLRPQTETTQSESGVPLEKQVALPDDPLHSESELAQSESGVVRSESGVVMSENNAACSVSEVTHLENVTQAENEVVHSKNKTARPDLLEDDLVLTAHDNLRSKSELTQSENDALHIETEITRSESDVVQPEINVVQSVNKNVTLSENLEDEVSHSENEMMRPENDNLHSKNQLAQSENDVVHIENEITRSESDVVQSKINVVQSENENVTLPESNLVHLEDEVSHSENKMMRPENDNLHSKSELAQSENDAVHIENEITRSESDVVQSEINVVQSENENVTLPESNLVYLEDEVAHSENKMMRPENDNLHSKSELAQSENDVVHIENEIIRSESDVVQSEINVVHSENESVTPPESNLVHFENEVAHSENEMMRPENDNLHSKSELAQSENDVVHIENEITRSESDVVQSKINVVQSENENVTLPESNLVHLEDEVSHAENEMMRPENDNLHSKSELVQLENDGLHIENEITRSESEVVQSKINVVQSENKNVTLPQNNLVHFENEVSHSENEIILPENDVVRLENNMVNPENATTLPENVTIQSDNNGVASKSELRQADVENMSSQDSTLQNLHITTSLPSIDDQSTSNSNNKLYQVPKLVDLIQDNDELMDYIITKYETESMGKMDDSLDSLEMYTEKNIIQNQEFLDEEVKAYEKTQEPQVAFDLSENQDEAMPNSLTHSSVFTSTPFTKRSLQELSSTLPHQDGFCSLNLFEDADKDQKVVENNSALYSLETWDNFLGKALDDQNESQANELFDSFSSEPQSLLFTENEILVNDNKSEESESQETRQDRTYTCDEKKNSTFAMDQNTVDINDINVEMECPSKDEDGGDTYVWESNGAGWFLHPQSNSDISGEITIPSNAITDSYVGFNVDDEIMAAVRNELLNKLPQAQGGSNGGVHDEEEWDSVERNEVFLRYNVYNTPLSPIPEESHIEDNSCDHTPRQHSEDEDEESDWSDHCDGEALQHDTGSHSIHHEPLHRHTPSQDSCCSNDTLFNLEELTCAVNDTDRDNNSPNIPKISSGESQCVEENLFVNERSNEVMSHGTNSESRDYDVYIDKKGSLEKGCESGDLMFENSEAVADGGCRAEDTSETVNEDVEKSEVADKRVIIDFLAKERQHDCSKTESSEESNSESTDRLLPFVNKQVAPLPSPEDKPWKQLPASLLSYDTVISQNMLLPTSEANVVPEKKDLPKRDNVELLYVNVPEKTSENLDDYDEHEYENVDSTENVETYEITTNIDDFYNEADYVNIVNLENTKNSAEFINHKQVINDKDDRDSPEYVNDYNQQNQLIISNEDERDIFGVLTDIRFSGPGDNQLMTTSFSESNDLNDEQDWDSGSDTRSSSSGEFIWKEGEHEESLKALRAAPQDVLEDIQPMEEIQEETSSESSSSDDDGESPEFVPSAWDKYATPTKSALRSPEKTLEKTEKKKSKGVWFKKQKYHCVYEYPREPDSPVLHSYDLWKPQPDYGSFDDWELDGTDPYVAPENSDDFEMSQNYYQPKSSRNLNVYQLSSIADFTSSESGADDEFYISSSAKPFDMMGGLSCQFFPGNWTELNKQTENATPDSGVEDITPGSLIDGDFVPQPRAVQSLKQLASDAVKKNKKAEEIRSNDVLGGLRHTRNKLKLDLPPSPSAFTSNRMFSIEPVVDDPVINREKPTFTTFGKSRFLVQHVDTPPDDEASKNKNVSFEALPYKPMQKHILKEDYDLNTCKGKVEMVRGEASLLDSADEDSGIESSTLERKLSNTV